MGGVKVAVVTAACFLVLAYTLYIPFPANFRRPGIGNILGISAKLVPLTAKLLAAVGIGTKCGNTRDIFHFLMTFGPTTFDSVQITRTEMDTVEVLVFTPSTKSEDLRSGMVFVHGGGWVLMDPDTYIPVCKELAEQTQGVIVAPHYRRAPEHVFPVALDDTIRVTKYFLQNAAKYGVDGSKIGIAGDSAGGNLAMATALKLSMEPSSDLPALRYQFLAYPCLQAFDFSLPSFRKYSKGPGFVMKETMVTYWQFYLFGDDLTRYDDLMANMHTSPDLKKSKYAAYVDRKLLPDFIQKEITWTEETDKGNVTLSDEIVETIVNPLVSPLMASDEQLSQLPPTHLLITEYDVLRDEGFLLAARLEQVGVPVEMDYYPDDEHGLITLVAVDDLARESIKRAATFVNQTLATV